MGGGGRGPAAEEPANGVVHKAGGAKGRPREAGGEDGRGPRRMLAPGHDPHRCHVPEPPLSPTSSMASGVSTSRQAGFSACPLS